MGAHATKVAKNLNNECGQKLKNLKNLQQMHLKLPVKKQKKKKTAEATGDLIGNTITNYKYFKYFKITSISKKPASGPHSNAASNEIPKERYISLQERQKIIDELRLI